MTRMAFDLSEVADNTPEHRAICEDIIKKGDLVGMKMCEPLRADKTQVRFPGAAGGPEWGGGAFDPQRSLFIFNSNEMGYVERLVKRGDEWHMTTARFVDPKTQTPCHIPPWGELIAVDVNTAEVAWRSRLGVTDHFPEGKRDTGRGQQWRADRDRQRRHLHRRHRRCALPRLRQQDRQGVVDLQAGLFGARHAHDLSGQGWAAICGHRGDRRVLSQQPGRRRQSDGVRAAK